MSADPGIRLQVHHPRSAGTMFALARWSGVDDDVTAAAIDNLRSGAVSALLVSGAQASGKDSVCPGVLVASNVTGAVQCRVAHAIRAEMAGIIELVAAAATPSQSAACIAGTFDVSEDTGRFYTDLFFGDTRVSPHGIDVYERTERMRRALQWHGDEGKRHRPGYWVKTAYRTVIPTLAAGTSVYLTDGRFPGEVDAGRVFGAYCVRLYVPEDVRIARIKARDGFVPSLETLRHPGETALDGYWGLDLEFENTCPVARTVEVIAELFDRHRDALTQLT